MNMRLRTSIPEEGGVRGYGSKLNELIPLEMEQNIGLFDGLKDSY